MDANTRKALRLEAQALEAALELLAKYGEDDGHYGGCHSLPIKHADGSRTPTGSPCDCGMDAARAALAAIKKLIQPKRRKA